MKWLDWLKDWLNGILGDWARSRMRKRGWYYIQVLKFCTFSPDEGGLVNIVHEFALDHNTVYLFDQCQFNNCGIRINDGNSFIVPHGTKLYRGC